MSAKTIIFLCIQGFMACAVFAQCYGNVYNPAYGLAGSGYNMAGSGIGLAGNGIGLAGNGIGLAGNGIGLAGNGIGLAGSGIGCAGNGIVSVPAMNSATINGGGFTVTSSSPIAPSGVSVVSEYVIEGPLTVGGQLPVMSAVTVDAQLPTSGAAGTSYSCGNGNVGILEEQVYAANGAAAAAANSAALGVDLALSRSSGCGVY